MQPSLSLNVEYFNIVFVLKSYQNMTYLAFVLLVKFQIALQIDVTS